LTGRHETNLCLAIATGCRTRVGRNFYREIKAKAAHPGICPDLENQKVRS